MKVRIVTFLIQYSKLIPLSHTIRSCNLENTNPTSIPSDVEPWLGTRILMTSQSNLRKLQGLYIKDYSSTIYRLMTFWCELQWTRHANIWLWVTIYLGPCHAHTLFIPVCIHRLYPIFLQIFTHIFLSKCIHTHAQLILGVNRQLKDALPVSNQKSSKVSLLDHATTHIKYLEMTQQQLQARLQQVENEISHLHHCQGRFEVCQTSSIINTQHTDGLCSSYCYCLSARCVYTCRWSYLLCSTLLRVCHLHTQCTMCVAQRFSTLSHT